MQKLSSISDALNLFKNGDTLYIPGVSSEPRELTNAISAAACDLGRLYIVSGFISGINNVPLADQDNLVSETVFFPRPQQHRLTDRIVQLPLSYYGINNYLGRCHFDWGVIHVSAPDKNGNCSLGISAEFQLSVVSRAKHILAVVNRQMPSLPGSCAVNVQQIDFMVEADFPLVTYDTGEADDSSSRIAENVCTLIDSQAVIQTGLGKVPDKLLSSLCGHKKLRFHSGMISDGFIKLLNAGSLDTDFFHTTCSALGSENFYRQLKDIDCLHIRGVDKTHAPQTLCGFDNLTAINSALEVDLFGQANLEMTGGRQVSNVGGAADFARAASQSKQGKSIIALPATAANGKYSRIVPSFDAKHMVSLPRYDVDYVVTEFGIAKLKDCSSRQRAEALINIAAPAFREALSADLSYQ